MAYSITNANDAASTPRNPATIVAAIAPPVVFGKTRIRGPKDEPADQGGDEGHVENVQTQDDDPPVGKHEGLDDDHDGHDQGAHPRAQEDRGQRPAEEMAAGAGRHREVEHLDREHERGGQPGHRNLLVRPGACRFP